MFDDAEEAFEEEALEESLEESLEEALEGSESVDDNGFFLTLAFNWRY